MLSLGTGPFGSRYIKAQLFYRSALTLVLASGVLASGVLASGAFCCLSFVAKAQELSTDTSSDIREGYSMTTQEHAKSEN